MNNAETLDPNFCEPEHVSRPVLDQQAGHVILQNESDQTVEEAAAKAAFMAYIRPLVEYDVPARADVRTADSARKTDLEWNRQPKTAGKKAEEEATYTAAAARHERAVAQELVLYEELYDADPVRCNIEDPEAMTRFNYAAAAYVRFDRKAGLIREAEILVETVGKLLKQDYRPDQPVTSQTTQLIAGPIRKAYQMLDKRGDWDGMSHVLSGLRYGANVQKMVSGMPMILEQLSNLRDMNAARKTRFLERYTAGERLDTLNAVHEISPSN